jgi:hypothetical protein
LIAASRGGPHRHLSDIVATIQGEHEVIRSPCPACRSRAAPAPARCSPTAAYLLYTHRHWRPGRWWWAQPAFLGYIERVLPSLGEAGVELAVLADLVEHGSWSLAAGDAASGRRPHGAVPAKAVRPQRPPRRSPRVPYGVQTLVVPAGRTAEIGRRPAASGPQRGRRFVRASCSRRWPTLWVPGHRRGGERSRRSREALSACGRC